jgi:hypothetical protein
MMSRFDVIKWDWVSTDEVYDRTDPCLAPERKGEKGEKKSRLD